MADEMAEKRQLLIEKYSFISAQGTKYTVKPATMAEMLDGSFMEKINAIGIPDIEKSPRMHFAMVLSDENKRQALNELIEKYIYIGEKPIKLEDADFTADDLILVMLRLAGISG
jgi:hypothetical protein